MYPDPGPSPVPTAWAGTRLTPKSADTEAGVGRDAKAAQPARLTVLEGVQNTDCVTHWRYRGKAMRQQLELNN